MKKTVFTLMTFIAASTWGKPQKSMPHKRHQLKAEAELYEIKMGDTVSSILSRRGFKKTELRCLQNKGAFSKLPYLSAEAPYLSANYPKPHGRTVKIYTEDMKWSYSYWKRGTDCGYRKEPIQWEVNLRVIEGKIKGSLFSTLSSYINDDRMITRFMDAYRFCCNLKKDLVAGSPFSLVIEEMYDHGEFVKYGEILSATIDVAGQQIHRKFKRFDGGSTYIGKDLDRSDAPLYAPVGYFHISSLYQRRRLHPVKGRTQAHKGIDFALPTGEEVYAPANGVVFDIGKNRASGRFVAIRHDNGLETRFLHLSKIPETLKEKDHVKAGDTIGYIGCTGYCTKPHLHFAVKRNGRYIDPLPLIKNFPKHAEEDVIRSIKKL